MRRTTRFLFLAAFSIAFAVTLLVLRHTRQPPPLTVAASAYSAPVAAPAPVNSETRIAVEIAPSVVHVPVRAARTNPVPQPDVAKAQAEFLDSILQTGQTANPLYTQQPLLPSNASALAAHNRAPDADKALSRATDVSLRLAALASTKKLRDTEEIMAVLQRYSRAWNAKDIADIRAVRPGLERRTLKEELAAARTIDMQIRPVGAPRIEGDRAIVECLHRVDQVFEDGTEKQSPGVRMTYVLVKRGGAWLIADTR